MPVKLKSIFLYVLGSLVILFCLFVYWVSREIPLPSNAKKVGDMIHIDISEGATDTVEKAQGTFVVPERFKPSVSDRAFSIYIKYPVAMPYSGNDFPLPKDQVRVALEHHIKASALPSEYLLRKIQPSNGPLFATPWLEATKNGIEVYRYKIDASAMGTYYKFTANDGGNIVVDDPGDWSRDYIVNRALTPHIALLYLPPKNLIRNTHFTADITAVDNVVLKLMQTFQTK
jgi:hypothetical protein